MNEMMGQTRPATIGRHFAELVEVKRPQMDLTFNAILNFINAVFVLRMRTPTEMKRKAKEGKEGKQRAGKAKRSAFKEPETLRLKGQMMLMEGGDKIIFIGSPYVTTIPELLAVGLHINTIPIRDVTRDLILLNQQRLAEVQAQ